MTLINGPYDGLEMDNPGMPVVTMEVYDGGFKTGAIYGHARYESSPDGSLAFFEGNTWLGPLLAIVL